MSFFTLDSFQNYHQQVGEVVATKLQVTPRSSRNISKGANDKEERRRAPSPTQSAITTSTTARHARDLDPVSVAHVVDPWLGKPLLTPTACSYIDSAEGATASAVAATSLKVVAVDHPNEGWGDFVSFFNRGRLNGSSNELMSLQRNESDSDKDSDSHNSETQLEKDQFEPSKDQLGPSISSSGTLQTNSPAHNALITPAFSSRESKGVAATLLDRLWLLGSSLSPLSSPSSLTRRSYDSYDVTFEKGPVGLNLETDWYGRQAVVKGFRAINGAGDDGPAKQCGMIRVGDVLTSINGKSCLEMDFQETLEALRLAGTARHTLHFKSLEAAGDLSRYASNKDVVEARAYIHQHKQRFYRPPPIAEGANAHELQLGCVERLRGEFVTAFNFHREETGEFLLAASCASDGSGPFLFHTLRDSHLRTMRDLPQSEDSAVYLGWLDPNFLGTEFTLFDHHTGSTKKHESELALLVYTANFLGRVPNSLKCIIPKPVEDEQDDDGLNTAVTIHQQPSGMGSDRAMFNTHRARSGCKTSLSDRYKCQQQSRTMSITERLRSFTLNDLDFQLEMVTEGALSWLDKEGDEDCARSMRVKHTGRVGGRTASLSEISYGALEQEEYAKDLLVFETKQSTWNEELCAWTLNFHGRVKVASKKNFLLIGTESDENGDEKEVTALRFGKVSKTRFTLDYTAPLAPIQALAVACSAFANKRVVT